MKFRAKFEVALQKYIIQSVVANHSKSDFVTVLLRGRKRGNSTEFLFNTATIRKAKLNCISLLFAQDCAVRETQNYAPLQR